MTIDTHSAPIIKTKLHTWNKECPYTDGDLEYIQSVATCTLYHFRPEMCMKNRSYFRQICLLTETQTGAQTNQQRSKYNRHRLRR